MASRAKPPEVWVIGFSNDHKLGEYKNFLALDLWFGSKEKAEAYMSKHELPNPRYRPVRLRESQ